MVLYTYEAISKKGSKTKANIEAESIADAKDKIRELDVLLCRIEPFKGEKKKGKLSSEALCLFTNQLYQLLSSKIPLYESLKTLEEQTREETFHQTIVGICERIRKGSSLSDAMREFPESFSVLYYSLIAAGEASGSLERVLFSLNAFLQEQNKLKKDLYSALLYPAILLVLMALALVIMLGYVIPSIQVLFEEKTVPLFTQIVFRASALFRSFGFEAFIGAVLISIAFGIQLKKEKTKIFLQTISLKIPIVKSFVLGTNLSKFSRSLATLLQGGIPLTGALDYALNTVENYRIRTIFQHCKERIVEGVDFSQEVLRYEEIPVLYSRMVKIGEESGRLSEMLFQLAFLYEEDTKRKIHKLVALLQPILLLSIGIFIGLILLSILLPLSDFGSSVEF